ncbi:MAG: hypothetical protein Q4A71_03850 [Actinomycetaceae bacterium]|nr:hypothetical protein [Actinomycetaceae bacterium]
MNRIIPYLPSRRIVHVNDIAGVGASLVRGLREFGEDATLRSIPDKRTVKNEGALALARLANIARWRLVANRYDILHLHYVTHSQYLRGFKGNVVAHAHGSDLLGRRRTRALKYAAYRADIFLYSTKNLRSLATQLRSDAIYLPNPIDEKVFQMGLLDRDTEYDFFVNCRWDGTKGSSELLKIATDLLGKGFTVFGLDWGIDAPLARSVGVHLLPLMNKSNFLLALQRAKVVIGQQKLGALGISDLETIALKKPLVANGELENLPIYDTYGRNSADLALEAIEELQTSAQKTRLEQASREVKRIHEVSRVSRELVDLYEQI